MALSDGDVGGTRALHALSDLLPSSWGTPGKLGQWCLLAPGHRGGQRMQLAKLLGRNS